MNYQRIYHQLIDNRKINTLGHDVYGEIHHIIPRCLGGSNSKSNLIRLSAREHILVHYLLVKIYPEDRKLIYAFNRMCSMSSNQERHYNSRMYALARKLFIEHHPMKNEETRKKVSKSLKLYYNSPTRYCKNCSNELEHGTKYCSDECKNEFKVKRDVEEKIDKQKKFEDNCKPCPVCGVKHTKKYCCSRECFNIYITYKDNEYSKNASIKRETYIENNYDKIVEINKKISESRDCESVNKKISATKKAKGLGNSNSKSNEIRIYNANDELIFISPKGKSFKEFCIENNLPMNKLVFSYKNNKKMHGNYKGWYAIRIKENDGNDDNCQGTAR